MRGSHRHDPEEIVDLHHHSVTGVGWWLRRLKIDETPQICDVVTGAMSVVGPRPTIPEQTDTYDAFQQQRLFVRPGLTGLAQVNGSAATSWEERIKYDVFYVRNLSFVMDLKILLKTIWVIGYGEEKFTQTFDQSPYADKHGPAGDG